MSGGEGGGVSPTLLRRTTTAHVWCVIGTRRITTPRMSQLIYSPVPMRHCQLEQTRNTPASLRIAGVASLRTSGPREPAERH
jgi:hypothetical protein